MSARSWSRWARWGTSLTNETPLASKVTLIALIILLRSRQSFYYHGMTRRDALLKKLVSTLHLNVAERNALGALPVAQSSVLAAGALRYSC